MKVQLFIAAGVAALCAAGAASAATPEVEIEDAVARVVVVPEARSDIGVDIRPGRADLPQLKVRRFGDRIEIDGGLDRRIRGCSAKGRIEGLINPAEPPADLKIEVKGLPDVSLPDAPLITLRVPMNVKVSAGGAVFGAIGRSDSVDLGAAGCGDWTVANTAGKLELSVAGSGDIQTGVSSSVEASIAGSGDIRTGATRAFEASVAGSGDVKVARVDGPVEVSIAGSGDVSVEAGHATKLEASIAGSGDVRFNGEADSVEASIIGSGDVYVASTRGSVSKHVMGSGDVVVGSR